MKIIRGIVNLNNQFSRCVLTLGNFDGVHLGHQQLLAKLVEKGRQLNLPTVVLLFEPQPLEFFAKSNAPSRITSFQEKVRLIEKIGVDYILAAPFTKTLANLSPHDFINTWLINKLQAKYIIVGDDFRFGSQRKGDVAQLCQYGHQNDFAVESMPAFVYDDLRISSTEIRKALKASDFRKAKALLGRSYAIEGFVVHGNALARQLGFPTANVHLHRKKTALRGVYFVTLDDVTTGQHYSGVANIGTRPTIYGKTAILEVNIFDFSGDIYDHYVVVTFIEKLRDEKKFDSLDELKQHISQDVCIAKAMREKYANHLLNFNG